jgi:F-type H+-transporting ATPase subunit epsilon
MSESILLEIVTPTGVALRKQVADVTAPRVAGEFGVMPGHVPLLAALRTGIVTYHESGKEHRHAVAHGFVEVIGDKALVLTERFMSKDDVDVVKVRLRLKEVDAELDRWQGDMTDPKRKLLIEEEQWLATQLDLIGDPPLPIVREDTRFLAAHVEAPPFQDMIDGQMPDVSLTDYKKGGGTAFPDDS